MGYFFILIRMESVYDLVLPSEVRKLLSRITIIISVGLTGSQDVLTCTGLQGYLNRLRFWMYAHTRRARDASMCLLV